MNEIDVSVVLAVHNAAEALPRWLAHLEHQTLPAVRYEVVIVDDGSADGTPEVLDRFAEGAPIRIRSIRQEHGGAVRARNLGIREAHGRWILFLSLDLLASPNLLERHICAQEIHEGNVLAVGSVSPHPQLPPASLTPWFLPQDRRQLQPGAVPHFLDCCGYNLSLPSQMIRDSGGFDELFVLAQFDDAELVWRLLERDVQACYLDEAYGYVWRPTSFEAEHQRQYDRGYSLFRLEQITQSTDIARRFPVRRNAIRAGLNALVMPFYVRACRQAEVEDIRLLGHIYRRVLRHAFLTGYADAQNGRPPARLVTAV